MVCILLLPLDGVHDQLTEYQMTNSMHAKRKIKFTERNAAIVKLLNVSLVYCAKFNCERKSFEEEEEEDRFVPYLDTH